MFPIHTLKTVFDKETRKRKWQVMKHGTEIIASGLTEQQALKVVRERNAVNVGGGEYAK